MLSDNRKSTTTEKTPAFEQVAEALRRRIVSGEIEPGARLQVEALRREYDVSTSTIREALSRLLADSVVISQPQQGFSVASLSRHDCRAIADIRRLLESEAIRNALHNRSDAWEARLAGTFHMLARADRSLIIEKDYSLLDEWRRRNADFHDALVSTCNNAYVMQFRRVVHLQSERYRAILPDANVGVLDVPAQHQAIFETAISGREDACVAATIAHIETTVAIIVDRLPFD